ncbi:MAG: glutamate--tRNA ligase [Candidatus Aenigmarchaeota archaeon]|nr:glutamate--tRNA ligase [Candidatus Aenigmarchaeota archaeon]
MDVDGVIRRYALINAVEHDGTAQPKSVLGKVLAEHPDLRSRVLEIRSAVELVVDDVNRLGIQKQRAELGELPARAKQEERKGLPELDLTREKFVVRFAPNPDGALHLGNARPAVLSYEYAKKYNGSFILRFDDTDPKVKVPEKQFYEWIREDLRWLGIKWTVEMIASKRLPLYYKHAEKLMQLNGAYVCTCGDAWKALRDQGKACPCRNLEPKAQLKKWKRMLAHKFREGEAVLRIKTDLDAKNPAVRDWAAFRIVDVPRHPLEKRKKVWPLYNFASAIDDYLAKVTHIFRGQEHSTNEVKQRFLYQHFRWSYPFVITLGRFSLSDMVLSKSTIREGILNHEYNGWTDLRLGTLRALRRRGFQPEAIRTIVTEIGPKPNDITISLENLAAYNRKIIDKLAHRYFFIPNPKKIIVGGMKMKSVSVGLHPDKKGNARKFSITSTFYIDLKDFERYKSLEIRLKDLCNIKLGEKCEFTSRELKAIPKIQWVPAKHIQVRIFKPGKEIKGYGETNLLKEKVGAIVQFERFGFVRIEKKGAGSITAAFAHE